MTTLDDTRCCPMCEDAAKKILELEQRVKVLTDACHLALDAFEKNHCIDWSIIEDAINSTPQQTAAQIERGHIEWMKTFKLTEDMLAAGADMFEKTLHSSADFKHHAAHVFEAMCDAIPLPKESDSPETDLDEALRRQ